jgi:hypothetical protein
MLDDTLLDEREVCDRHGLVEPVGFPLMSCVPANRPSNPDQGFSVARVVICACPRVNAEVTNHSRYRLMRSRKGVCGFKQLRATITEHTLGHALGSQPALERLVASRRRKWHRPIHVLELQVGGPRTRVG